MVDLLIPPARPRQDGARRVDTWVKPANEIREALGDGRFFWTLEYVPSIHKVLRDDLAKLDESVAAVRANPTLAGFAIADRVVTDRDPDPISAGLHLLSRSHKQPIVHLSGKDRDVGQFEAALTRMAELGLENMLLVTGDRLRDEPRDRRPRYLESVAAIAAAKKRSANFLIAAAVNPFKYREEDAMAQYLKMGKKIRAGADLIITQIGYDMIKMEEAVYWLGARDYRVPLVANLMPMFAARARYIRSHQLAGVTVTDSFLALLEAEERLMSDKGASRVLRRLALQIVGVQHLGYAGVQISGVHSPSRLEALQAEVESVRELCADRQTWRKAWDESLTVPEGDRAVVAPGGQPWYLLDETSRSATWKEKSKYRIMKALHGFAFDRGLAARLIGPILKRVKRHSVADRLLERVERATKQPIFGCETCGMCRLAVTQYVCPETCPKGLANGACGGTTENLCEFRDRECIHSVKYRIAKAAGRLDELESVVIPAVPARIRYTSSWPPHFRGQGAERSPVPLPTDGPNERN